MNKYMIVIALCVSLVLPGCETKIDEDLTTMAIEDPERHYFPIMQGQKQEIKIKIFNTGDELLKISKVLPSCGCIVSDFSTMAIAVGEHATLRLEYDSTKNTGFVQLYTTIIANTSQRSDTFVFDLNVVPDADYIKDYEELYMIEQNKIPLNKLADGKTKRKGYSISTI